MEELTKLAAIGSSDGVFRGADQLKKLGGLEGGGAIGEGDGDDGGRLGGTGDNGGDGGGIGGAGA